MSEIIINSQLYNAHYQGYRAGFYFEYNQKQPINIGECYISSESYNEVTFLIRNIILKEMKLLDVFDCYFFYTETCVPYHDVSYKVFKEEFYDGCTDVDRVLTEKLKPGETKKLTQKKEHLTENKESEILTRFISYRQTYKKQKSEKKPENKNDEPNAYDQIKKFGCPTLAYFKTDTTFPFKNIHETYFEKVQKENPHLFVNKFEKPETGWGHMSENTILRNQQIRRNDLT